jgi:glucokinase
MEKNRDSALWDIVSGDIEKVEGKTAFVARRVGDAAAMKVVEAYIDDLACGIINVINILQPDIMCVGGGVANEGEALLAPLRERVKAEVFSQNSVKNTVIVKAKLGNNAGIIGAAHLYRTIEEE